METANRTVWRHFSDGWAKCVKEEKLKTSDMIIQQMCAVWLEMKTECTTLRNTINHYQTQCEMARPGLEVARRPVGCRLSLKFSLQNKGTGKGKGTWHRRSLVIVTTVINPEFEDNLLRSFEQCSPSYTYKDLLVCHAKAWLERVRTGT